MDEILAELDKLLKQVDEKLENKPFTEEEKEQIRNVVRKVFWETHQKQQ